MCKITDVIIRHQNIFDSNESTLIQMSQKEAEIGLKRIKRKTQEFSDFCCWLTNQTTTKTTTKTTLFLLL
jgi:hypothetical protein